MTYDPLFAWIATGPRVSRVKHLSCPRLEAEERRQLIALLSKLEDSIRNQSGYKPETSESKT